MKLVPDIQRENFLGFRNEMLADTSVLTAALLQRLSNGPRAQALLARIIAGEFGEWLISQHTILEVYSNLTRMPIPYRMTPQEATDLIRANTSLARIIPYAPSDYFEVLERGIRLGVTGGTIYDALIAHAAHRESVDFLFTLNPSDFVRVWPEGAGRIREP